MPEKNINLTVSLIVKDEEQNLPACLSAVRRLTDAVGGEIIVTDTGSTDRTVEIAQNFADLVLHVPWENDFAKARNAAIPHVRGRWLMYIDGDEVLDEDLSDAVSFFNSGEEKNYHTAAYIQRNYTEIGRTDSFSDFSAIRLWRMRPGICFRGAIHEAIPYVLPVRSLKLIAHHFGYAGMEKGEHLQKLERNRKILLSLPPDVRTLIHLSDTFPMDVSKRIEYLEQAKARLSSPQAAKWEREESWRVAVYLQLTQIYHRTSDAEKLEETVREYWSAKPSGDSFAGELDLLLYAGLLYLKQGKKLQAEKTLSSCLHLYERLDEGNLETPDLHLVSISALKEQNRFSLYLLLAQNSLEKGQWPDAKSLLSSVRIESASRCKSLPQYLKTQMDYAFQSGDMDILPRLYAQILCFDDGKAVQEFQKQFQKAFPLEEENTFRALKSLVEDKDLLAEAPADPFLMLCRACVSKDGTPDCGPWLESLFSADVPWTGPYFGEAFYLAIKGGTELCVLENKIKEAELLSWVKTVSKVHDDFPLHILEWLERTPSGKELSLPMLQWRCILTANGLARFVSDDTPQERLEAYFDSLCRDLCQLISGLYRPEAFQEENRSILPILHQVGFHCSLAFQSKEKGDLLEYLRQLKEIALISPELSQAVRLLAAQVQSQEQRRNQEAPRDQRQPQALSQATSQPDPVPEPGSEFQALAMQVKEQILTLIRQERFEEASQVLAAYGGVNPGDPAIEELAALIREHKAPENM